MSEEKKKKINRRQQILEVLAAMLESHHGERITTASLAKEVGVTEAALYRHFPSKAKMFEGLVEFTEEAVFSRITRIKQDTQGGVEQLQKILTLVMAFCEKNPGICRLMMGEVLAGENPRVRQRTAQFFERLETEVRQVLRDTEIRENKRTRITSKSAANLLVLNIEGRIHQYVRTEFKQKPTENWSSHWPILAGSLF